MYEIAMRVSKIKKERMRYMYVLLYHCNLNPYKIKGKTVATNAIPLAAESISVVIAKSINGF